MREMDDLLYRYYARAAYGTDLPQPHFYLGSNRNGDLKLRSILPISLLMRQRLSLLLYPLSHLVHSRESMQAMLEDLAFGQAKLRSFEKDYRGKYTPALAEAEYERFRALAADPNTILGMSRAPSENSDE